MSSAPWVVFGAWDKPNKAIAAIRSQRVNGWEIHICEVDNDGSYEYGEKKNIPIEKFGGEYCTLVFCRKESLRAFIDGLENVYREWEEEK